MTSATRSWPATSIITGLRTAGQFREKFGVAGEGDAGVVDHGLVDGCRDQRIEVPLLAARAGRRSNLEDVGPVARVEPAGHGR